jgi:uncharacterized membrane protein
VSSSITGVSQSSGSTGLVEDHDLPWWARSTGFGWINVVCGVFSLLATCILVGERLQLFVNADYHPSCDFGGPFSCTSVMKSDQAALFGFPNPFIGLVGFTILVVTGVVLVAGAALPKWYWNVYALGNVAAFVFLVWLYSQAVFEIKALCIYCMICWLMMTFQVFLVLARNVLVGAVPAPGWLAAWARNWAWITAVVVVLACAASIFIKFMAQFLSM